MARKKPNPNSKKGKGSPAQPKKGSPSNNKMKLAPTRCSPCKPKRLKLQALQTSEFRGGANPCCPSLGLV